jgi:hypothetical protein
MDIWDFNQIRWGQDEAKGDEELLEYFVPFPEFELVKSGDVRYVIGRKGTGKTAVIERLRLEAEDDPMRFNSTLTLRNFPINDVRDLRDRSFRDKSQFVPVWLFLIYVELAKLVIEDHGSGTEEAIRDLERFLIMNNLTDGIGFIDTVTILKSTGSKIKVLAKWIEGEYQQSDSAEVEIQVHYQKVVDILRRLLSATQSESQYWLFMDELDEGFRAGDTSLRLLLLALLRAVEDSALALQRTSLNYRPLLVLRSDIFDRLEDNDLNKLDDYLIRLKWTSKEEGSEYALKNVPVARIVTGLKLVGIDDPWCAVVDNTDTTLPNRVETLWQYMANRTYERPRDIIKFLKNCKLNNHGGRLTFDEVKTAENAYSTWLYNELRDEIHSYLPVWKEALQCLTRIGTGKIPYSEYVSQLRSDRVINKWLKDHAREPEEIIESLFDFGVLGNLDGKRWLFKYKDDDLAWNPSMDLIVHFGLNRKLRLFRR